MPPQITAHDFWIKISVLAVTLLFLLLYFIVRFLISGKNSLISGQALEEKFLKRKPDTLQDLQTGNWLFNAETVVSFSSFSLGTLILGAVFIFEQRLAGYDQYIFNLILAIFIIAVLSYFISLQLWFLALDVGETPQISLKYRQSATLFQTLGWLSMILAAMTSVMAVNTSIGIFSSILFILAIIFIFERKLAISKTQAKETTLNPFQKSLKINKLYWKNTELASRPPQKSSLRIMTWNIERGYHPESIIHEIQNHHPDIVCLQEVDWGNKRTQKMDILKTIAQKTGMVGVFGIEFYEIGSPYRSPSIAGGGVHGNAVLSRITPEDCFRIELPNYYDWESPPEKRMKPALKEARRGNRFALCVDISLQGKSFTICSTHMEDKYTNIQNRFEQFKAIQGYLERKSTNHSAHIIAGDFNTLETPLTRVLFHKNTPNGEKFPFFKSECEIWKKDLLPGTGYKDPFSCRDWTFKKTFLYKEKLDWIAAKNCTIKDHGVGQFQHSDHRPLWIEISVS
jgi:endonuclease/exonuclease/phosphatase family metal-dependent hydrolase